MTNYVAEFIKKNELLTGQKFKIGSLKGQEYYFNETSDLINEKGKSVPDILVNLLRGMEIYKRPYLPSINDKYWVVTAQGQGNHKIARPFSFKGTENDFAFINSNNYFITKNLALNAVDGVRKQQRMLEGRTNEPSRY